MKNKNKKQIMNLLIFCSLPLFALISIFFTFLFLLVQKNLTFSYIIVLVLFLLGFSLFLKAKISVIKNGKIVTFGSSLMTRINKVYYRLGYALMIIGGGLSLVTVLGYISK